MSYNKRIWANGDLITKERMNNIEDGIYDAHDKINAINNKVEENTTDTNTARQDISDIKLQIGTEELTTTSKKIKGAINDLNSQIKDIAEKGTTVEVLERVTKEEIDRYKEAGIFLKPKMVQEKGEDGKIHEVMATDENGNVIMEDDTETLDALTSGQMRTGGGNTFGIITEKSANEAASGQHCEWVSRTGVGL